MKFISYENNMYNINELLNISQMENAILLNFNYGNYWCVRVENDEMSARLLRSIEYFINCEKKMHLNIDDELVDICRTKNHPKF